MFLGQAGALEGFLPRAWRKREWCFRVIKWVAEFKPHRREVRAEAGTLGALRKKDTAAAAQPAGEQ